MENAPISTEDLAVIKKWLDSGSINIFGLPFAGKDTHGRTLSEMLDAPLLGGGDILRNSVISPKVKAVMETGDLIPTADYIAIVLPYLSNDEFINRPLILSSVGRWIGEEQGVLEAAQAAGHPVKAVVYLHLSEDLVHQRWRKSLEIGDRGDRSDDDEHKLDTRISEFNQKTLPVIEEYRKMGLLIEVNSDADKAEVLHSILARLYMLAQKRA